MSQGAAQDGPRFYQVITRLSTVSMKSPQAVGPRPDGAPPRAAPARQDSRTLRATCQTRVVPQANVFQWRAFQHDHGPTAGRWSSKGPLATTEVVGNPPEVKGYW